MKKESEFIEKNRSLVKFVDGMLLGAGIILAMDGFSKSNLAEVGVGVVSAVCAVLPVESDSDSSSSL